MDLEFKKLYLNEFMEDCKSLCKNNNFKEYVTVFKSERKKKSYKNYLSYENSNHTDADKKIFKSNNKKLKMIQDIFDDAIIYNNINNYNSLKRIMNSILKNDYINRKKVSYNI